jgi:hypothetical protein
MRLWVEPAGGEQKSADIERKMVTLIYPYPTKIHKKKMKGAALVSNLFNHTIEKQLIIVRMTIFGVLYHPLL